MSIQVPRPPDLGEADVVFTAEYLVSYGKSGAFGRFVAEEGVRLRRGARVVVHTPRGLELGAVLCPATLAHAQLLTHEAAGRLLRGATGADTCAAAAATARAQQLFDDAIHLARDLAVPVQILDAEMLLDGGRAILQYLGPADVDITPLADGLAARHDMLVLFENLALPLSTAEEEAQHGGCGEPNCGRVSGGGCTDCSSGGCSSCGSGKVDMSAYFAHLRTQMENQRRVPLA